MKRPKRVVYKGFKKYLGEELVKDQELKTLYQIERVKLKFAHLLAYAREGMHLTQKQLADKIGVKQQLISRIESGSENLTLETLTKILTSLKLALKIAAHVRKNQEDIVELIKS
jgi:DNA-binding XRE family transcriptional regulator